MSVQTSASRLRNWPREHNQNTGVTITSKFPVSDHIHNIIKDCAPILYALRILRAHGMNQSAVQTVCHSVVLIRLLHAAPAWRDFFFHPIAHPSSSLHSLLLPTRDSDLPPRLRAPTKFPRIPTRTKKIWVIRIIRPFPSPNIDSIFTYRLYTPSSIITLISIAYTYVVVKSFYFSIFQLLLSVHVPI